VNEKTLVGVNVISSVFNGWIEIVVSLYVIFSIAVPLFVSFIVGFWVVNIKPGLIDRIWVRFVESWIVKFCWIIFDWSSPVSLNRMFPILIVKLPSRVV